MIYTELTNKAMRFAYRAHSGQTDPCGLPYIFHPFHLAEQMTDEYAVCAALLHDVVEDTDVTLDEIRQEFPSAVAEAVQLLTHEEGTDYYDYVRDLKSYSIARAVKLADLEHNSDQTRFAGCNDISEERKRRWREKYAKARTILMAGD